MNTNIEECHVIWQTFPDILEECIASVFKVNSNPPKKFVLPFRRVMVSHDYHITCETKINL
jgi:hypothetical protein